MNLRSALLLSALAVAGAANAAGLAGNSIAVYSVGTGAAALTSAATASSVLNYTTAGALVNSYAVPSSGANSLTNSGTATSEGQLNLTGDGKNLLFTGYRLDAGATGAAASTVIRTVGRIETGTGVVETSTSTTGFSGNNIRSAYSANSATYFAVGGNTGVVSGAMGTSTGSALANNAIVNFRDVVGFGGNVYASTASGASHGIFQIAADGTQTNVLNLGSTGSPYAFQFLSATSLLLADDTAGTGGITLYTNSGSGFVATSTVLAAPTRSFAVANGSVYFTSTDGTTLSSATFSGTSFGAASVIATAATNTAFRGLAFVPQVQSVPEPSALAALGLGAVALLRRRRKA